MDLNVVAEGKKRKKNKITVYTEDNENILFVKAILKTKASILDFVDVTLPCSTLTELVNKTYLHLNTHILSSYWMEMLG